MAALGAAMWLVGCADESPDSMSSPLDSAEPCLGGVIALEATPQDGPVGITLDVTFAGPGAADVACALLDAPPLWRQWLPLGSEWRFLEEAPAGDWTGVAYDDGTWPSGRAPFAANDEGATPLASPDGAVYFRASFVAPEHPVSELAAVVRRDDGVVVYLDGQEVFRDNVPEGPLSETTPALTELGNNAEKKLVDFAPSAAGLSPGPHVLAVELHPFDATDLAFDLRLAALVDEPVVSEEHRATTASGSTSESVTLLGLLADASYACTAAVPGCGTAQAVEVTTPPLPVSAPVLATRPGSAPTWGAYTLFNHQRPCPDEFANRLFLVDPDGRVRWHRHLGVAVRSSIDLEAAWLDDDSILWGGTDQPGGRPQILTLDHTILHEAGYPGFEEDIWHHDVVWDAGEILGLVNRQVTGAVTTEGFGLVAYDPAAQQVTWSWDAQDAVAAGQLPSPTFADPYHANSIAVVDDEDGPGIYVTLLESDLVVRIDRTTGAITWSLGAGGDFALVDALGQPLPPSGWFDGVHSIEVHGDRILLYENGRDVLRSQILELTVDRPNRVAAVTFTWTEPSWYEPVWGDVDELPNGNLLVAMAHNYCLGGNDAHPSSLLEIERATGTVPWRLDFLDRDDTMYRAQRLDGCRGFASSRFCPEGR